MFGYLRKNWTDGLTALKNADDLLKDVMKAVDRDGDGRIQYSGMFRTGSYTASMTDSWNENFETLSSKPKKNCGSFSRL